MTTNNETEFLKIKGGSIMEKSVYKVKPISRSELVRFLILGLIGLFLFIIPLPYKGHISILVGMMADSTKKALVEYLPAFMTGVIFVSALLSIVFSLGKSKKKEDKSFLHDVFVVKPMWLIFRVAGAIFAVLTYFKIGPEIIYGPSTGGTILVDLMPTLATWFFYSCIFLPFLMETGIMDYFGTLIRKFMRPIFKVPGRSAIDAIASWIGSGPVGVVITNKQYINGYYTAKESAIIASCFSLVSLPFAVVVSGFLGLESYFLQFYGTICLASLIAAIILPRIYPLKQIPEEYKAGVGKKINEEVPSGVTTSRWALEKGVEKSKTMPGVGKLVSEGLKTVIDVYMGLMPLVMAWGTLALILTEATPIFVWLSYPFISLFKLFGIADAALSAQATILGFADMFLPSIVISKSSSEMTKFIIGVLSFTQLVYLTETGAVILRSEIPLRLKELFIIFLERTLITLPIIILIAKMIF